MNSSFENKTNKYTLKRPISKELYDQANKMGIQIYDTSGRRASGVDSATNKVVYKHETSPASATAKPKTETGTIGAVGEINYKNLPQIGTNNVNGTNSGTSTKTANNEGLSQFIDTSKFDHLLYKQPKKTSNTTPEREGSRIKNRVTQVIKDQWKDPNASHLFDDIDDYEIEKSIPEAEKTIEKNIRTGRLGPDAKQKYPYLRDGLAVQYADNGTISPKAGRVLRDIMYQENSVNNTAKPLKSMGTPEFNNAYKNITKTGEALSSIQPMSMKVSDKNTDYSPKSSNISYADVPPTGSFQEWQQKNQAPKFPDGEFLPAPEKDNQSDAKDSSKTDKYSSWDAIVDLLPIPTLDDYNDLFTDIKDKDFISTLTDISRICFPFGLSKTTKTKSRLIWKLGADLYLRGAKGYTISADLLEHSLQEQPKDLMFDNNSKIAKEIKNNKEFNTFVDTFVENIENSKTNTNNTGYSFESKDGKDLYYSIHGCNVAVEDIKYNKDGTKDISIHISDTYDYTKIWTAMDGTTNGFDPTKISLGSVANDAGTISSWFDAINPYEIDIYLTIRR